MAFLSTHESCQYCGWALFRVDTIGNFIARIRKENQCIDSCYKSLTVDKIYSDKKLKKCAFLKTGFSQEQDWFCR